MTDKSVIDLIVAEAKREEAELFKVGVTKSIEIHKKRKEIEGGLTENSLISPHAYYKVVSLLDEPVSFDKFINFDKNIVATAGTYTIKYLPKCDRKLVKGKPYVIGQDLIHLRICVSGYKHWKCIGKRVPELGWMDRHAMISPGLFALAKEHPGMAFFFSVDWVKYANMIVEKAKAQGIDIDNKPFVSYKCSQKMFDEKYSKKHLNPKRGRNDYINEINEADKEARDNHYGDE